MIAYVDGEWLEGDVARTPIDDRGFLFGDGTMTSLFWKHASEEHRG